MSASLHTDSQWLEIFNTGKRNGEIIAEYGYSNDAIYRARNRLADQIEINYIDKNPGSHRASIIDMFHENIRQMLSWGWNTPSMVNYLKTAYNVEVSNACVQVYCNNRFEVAS